MALANAQRTQTLFGEPGVERVNVCTVEACDGDRANQRFDVVADRGAVRASVEGTGPTIRCGSSTARGARSRCGYRCSGGGPFRLRPPAWRLLAGRRAWCRGRLGRRSGTCRSPRHDRAKRLPAAARRPLADAASHAPRLLPPCDLIYGPVMAHRPLRPPGQNPKTRSDQRRERDSNPRGLAPKGFSRASHSAALPSLQADDITARHCHRLSRLTAAGQVSW